MDVYENIIHYVHKIPDESSEFWEQKLSKLHGAYPYLKKDSLEEPEGEEDDISLKDTDSVLSSSDEEEEKEGEFVEAAMKGVIFMASMISSLNSCQYGV